MNGYQKYRFARPKQLERHAGTSRRSGCWLREMRDEAGLSQRVMARMLGLEYYTFISQLENGRGRIPPNRYRDWANVLRVDDKVFAKTLLKFYEPVIYEMLFEDEAQSRPRISVA